MRVAILSSEAVPFAKTGGLGDVAGALPKFLRESGGADAFLVHPLYETTDRRHVSELLFDNLEVDWLGRARRAAVFYSEAAGAPSYLIDAPEYFGRPDVYGYRDDHERFAFFCRAALALFGRLGAAPDVVHLNDWPGGFAAVWLGAGRPWGGFLARTRTVFSIHNLAYQGAFDKDVMEDLGLPWELFTAEQGLEFYDSVNFLKGAIQFSDALT
ncbi:MAG: glycogen synthase, partial [Pyrinomonadaceae bacterium]